MKHPRSDGYPFFEDVLTWFKEQKFYECVDCETYFHYSYLTFVTTSSCEEDHAVIPLNESDRPNVNEMSISWRFFRCINCYKKNEKNIYHCINEETILDKHTLVSKKGKKCDFCNGKRFQLQSCDDIKCSKKAKFLLNIFDEGIRLYLCAEHKKQVGQRSRLIQGVEKTEG